MILLCLSLGYFKTHTPWLLHPRDSASAPIPRDSSIFIASLLKMQNRLSQLVEV
jgi:hypothetical protein